MAKRRKGTGVRGLTQSHKAMQERFAELVSQGVPPKIAAIEAGYTNGIQASYRLMRTDRVRKLLHGHRSANFEGDLAKVAMDTLKELMQEGPAAQRFQASRFVLENAGHVAASARQPEGEKELAEMTPDELQGVVRAASESLAEIVASLGGQHVVEGERRELRDVDGEVITEQEDDYANLLD